MKPGRCQPKPGIYPVVSYISAPRGWSFYKHMPITEDCGPEIVLNKSEIPHVAMSLTMNIFEPPNSSIPEKTLRLVLAPHPGRAPRKIPMMWSLFPEKSPGKSLEICMEFPRKSPDIPESVPDCPAKNLPDPSAAHCVAFQGWAPGYTTCRVNFGWGWGFALRLWKKIWKITTFHR